MLKATKEDLSSLYPKAKSFNEIQTKRKLRQLRKQPRFVAMKISSWLILGIVATLMAYSLASYLVQNNVNSEELSITTASLSILIASINLAILLYLYTLINNLLSRSLATPKLALAMLIVLLFFVGLTFTIVNHFEFNNLLTTIVILLFTFLVSYISLRHIIHNNNQ